MDGASDVERPVEARPRDAVDVRRLPRSRDLAGGVVGGLVAGAVFIGVTGWFAYSQGNPPLAPFKLISTLVLGGTPKSIGSEGIWIGAGIHAGLSIVFGVVFALFARLLRDRDALVSAGVAYGGLVYVLDFLILGHTVVPQFQMPNQPFELTVHLLFGALLAGTLGTRGSVGELVTEPARRRAARGVGALSAAGVALIHFALAGEHLQKEFYVGVLFVIGAIVLTYAAVQLARRPDTAAWVLGGLVMAGMFAGFLLARTTGLPSNYLEKLYPSTGIASLVMEAVFLAALVVALGGRSGTTASRRTRV